MAKAHVNMLSGSLVTNVMRFTVPIMLTNILQLLFNAADLIIVGQFCGSSAIAAVGATGSIVNLLVGLFIGLAVGVSVSVAHGRGAGDYERVHKTVHTAISVAVFLGVFFTVTGLVFAKPLLIAMDTPSSVLESAAVYLEIYVCGAVFSVVYNFGAAVMQAIGESKKPLYYLTVSGCVNVVLNLLFVCVFKMDVVGVALATVISQALSAGLLIYSLMVRDDDCRLFLKDIKTDKKYFAQIMRIGIPSGVQMSLFSIANVIIQAQINGFGDAALAGNSAASNIEGFLYALEGSFQQATIAFCGQNIGAGNYKRVRKVMYTCMLISFIITSCASTLSLIFAKPLLGIYLKNDMAAISFGLQRFYWLFSIYAVGGIMDVIIGAMKGIGKTGLSMVVSLITACGFRVAWIYTVFQIPKIHTYGGLLASVPISWIITSAVQLTFFMIITGKLIKNSRKA